LFLSEYAVCQPVAPRALCYLDEKQEQCQSVFIKDSLYFNKLDIFCHSYSPRVADIGNSISSFRDISAEKASIKKEYPYKTIR
jgi:hypothetical protein